MVYHRGIYAVCTVQHSQELERSKAVAAFLRSPSLLMVVYDWLAIVHEITPGYHRVRWADAFAASISDGRPPHEHIQRALLPRCPGAVAKMESQGPPEALLYFIVVYHPAG